MLTRDKSLPPRESSSQMLRTTMVATPKLQDGPTGSYQWRCSSKSQPHLMDNTEEEPHSDKSPRATGELLLVSPLALLVASTSSK